MKLLIKFFAITFAMTWTLWLAAALIWRIAPGRAFLFLPGTIAPAVVALFLTVNSEGQLRARALLGRAIAWRVPLRWYVFAIGYIAVIKIAAAAIQRAHTGAWPAFGSVPVALLLLATLVSTPVQAGEELGWRGYALPRMATMIGLRWSSIILGIVWAVWHLPLFFIPGVDVAGQSFPIYAIDVTALSVAFTYLYANTGGGLLLPMLLHAAVNNTTGIVPAAASAGSSRIFGMHTSMMGWLTGTLLWISAAYFLLRMPRNAATSSRHGNLEVAKTDLILEGNAQRTPYDQSS